MRVKLLKSMLFTVALGGGLLAAIYAGLLQPPAALRQQLRALLAAQGCEVKGEMRWEAGWHLSDLTIRRGGLEVHVERARIDAALRDWINGRLGRVDIEGASLQIDEAQVWALMRRLKGGRAAQGDGAGRLSGLDLRGARLTIKAPWGEAMIPIFQLKVEDDISGEAPMIVLAPRGSTQILQARAALQGGRLIVAGLGGSPSFSCIDEGGALILGGLTLDLKAGALRLQGVHLTRGEAHLDLKEAGISARGPLWLRGGQVTLPRLEIRPEIPCLTRPRDEPPTPRAPTPRAPTLDAALRRGLRLEAVTLHLGGAPPIEVSRGEINAQGAQASARVMGGEARLTTGPLNAGRPPKEIKLRITDVDLAALPQQRVTLAGRADLQVEAELDLEARRGCADLHVEAKRATLAHPAIAEAPLTGIDAGARGRLCWDKDALKISDGEAWWGAKLRARGALEVQGLTLKLKAALDKISCQAALDAAPRALLGPYQGVQLKGSLAPTLTLTLPLKAPAELDFTVRGLKRHCQVTALNAPPSAAPPLRNPVPGLDDVGWLNEPFIFDVREGVKAAISVGPGTSRYAPLATLPRYVGGAAYLSEEMGFYRGWALSWPLIKRGLRLSLAKGRFVYGGSTVTQQLVKNLFLTRDKTLARKLREALIASRVQDLVSRDRILELYLNCIEFGPDVYGIEAAAQHYFGKPAAALKAKEAVFLAMLKPAPFQGRWFKDRGRTPDYPWWTGRAETLMTRLVEAGMITREAAEAERPYSLRWQAGQYIEE